MIEFGTGGWRAVIGDGFTKENVEILTMALCRKMEEEGVAKEGCVIGYDRRFLSKEAMQWAAEVFAARGIHTWLINRSCPTPLVMYYCMRHGLPYGMMVTASHNPALYNGIKVFTRGGCDADRSVTEDIERRTLNVKTPVPSMAYEDARAEGLVEEIYPINEYLDSILSLINVDAVRAAGLKVALDPMYGVSETSIRTILVTARCEVETIHGRHDPLFGGRMPAPSEDGLRGLMAYVPEHHCDIGIATDGDADRIGVIDDTGRYLSPNEILVLLYYYLEKYKGEKGPVVRNICTTHLLDRIAAMFGEECYEVPVGFKYISAKMNETNAVIGGESSGGLAVRGHIHGKDGIYAAALLVEMLTVTGKRMSAIYDEISAQCGKIVMVENNYRFRKDRKAVIADRLLVRRELPSLPFATDHVSYLDGVKVYLENGGWICARFSGTEPLIRIFCEMEKREDAKRLCGLFRDFLGLSDSR